MMRGCSIADRYAGYDGEEPAPTWEARCQWCDEVITSFGADEGPFSEDELAGWCCAQCKAQAEASIK